MVRAGDLRQKEVVNLCDGTRLGFVYDLEIDFEKGTIEALIVPYQSKFFGFLGGKQEYIIPFSQIDCVGDDIILVKYHGHVPTGK